MSEDVTLVEFLSARLAADEERARMAICPCGGPVCTPDLGWMHMEEAVARLDSVRVAEHVVGWSPARVLAECEAKRQIVGRYRFLTEEQSGVYDWPEDVHREDEMEHVLKLLALPYADHEEYREEWKPDES